MERMAWWIVRGTTGGGLMFGLLGSECESDILRAMTPLLL